ncbi:MAG: hypothetical protein WC450_10190 [Candidatus Omnitrophota bacterium]|jgi:nucleoside 2-deoxyribosyltransferase
MNDKNICNFCSKQILKCYEDKNNEKLKMTCPLCGVYWITREAIDDTDFKNIAQNDLHLYSGYLRNNSFPENPKLITSEDCIKISEIVSPFKNMPVSEKVTNIIKYMYGSTTKVLGRVDIAKDDIYRFYLYAPGDFESVMKYLKERNLIKFDEVENNYICHLTIEGWEKYEELKEINIFSTKVFIACAFGADYQENLVKTIKSACGKCGFEANLVSDEKHNDDISHKIISDIKESRFVIADFTDQNNGAYFEAGYAMGLGLEVIKLCRKDHMDEIDLKTEKRIRLHFDTRQYSHIVWEIDKWAELEENLINQIKATIK